jgi:quercetin dioxygenase-like cupin family protein
VIKKDKVQPVKIIPQEIERSTSHIVVELVGYLPGSAVVKTILRKSTGEVKVMAFDSHERLPKKTYAFDSYVQIIDGKAEIIINEKSILLNTGEGIIVPAHQKHSFKPNGRFKIILTVIKSGYE